MMKHRHVQDYATWLTRQPFVRGGAADPQQGIVAHSMAAVERAIAAGHGVVLEAQRTFDNDAVVFGEATLDRLTGLQGEVRDHSSARLQAQTLNGTEEKLLSLSNMLLEINGRTPILIDARRPPKDPLPLCFAIRRAMEGYGGPIGIMALDPRILRWFGLHSRRVARGFVLTSRNTNLPWWARTSLWRLAALRQAKPDFIAVDLPLLPGRTATRLRKRQTPVLATTVRTDAEQNAARLHADSLIYAAEAACGLLEAEAPAAVSASA